MAASSKKGEQAAAAFVKRAILAIAPARLRHVGRKGSKLGVSYRPAGEGHGTLVKANGAWQIIERDTKAHLIGGGRSRYKEQRSYMQFQNGEIRLGPIHHPGTSGQHPFQRGVEGSRAAVPRIIDESVKVALAETFGF